MKNQRFNLQKLHFTPGISITITISITLLLIAAMVNHIVFSTSYDLYFFPLLGITMTRGFLYDMSLLFFIVSPIMLLLSLFLLTRSR